MTETTMLARNHPGVKTASAGSVPLHVAVVEQEEAQWQQRVAAYLAQRPASAGDPTMLQALKVRLFTVEEEARLAACEPAVMPLTGMAQ